MYSPCLSHVFPVFITCVPRVYHTYSPCLSHVFPVFITCLRWSHFNCTLYSGNPTQTWLQNSDDDGDSRLYVLRPGKKGKAPTEYYLDYFKRKIGSLFLLFTCLI